MKKKFLILHLITTLERGGAQNILLQIIKNNNKKKYNHIVVSLTDRKGIANDLETNGIKVYCLKGNNYLSFPILILKILRLVKSLEPNYIQSWLYHADLLAVIAKIFYSEANLIWTIHHASYSFSHDGKLTKFIVFLLSKLSGYFPKHIIYCSKYSYLIHKRLGYKKTNSKIIVNGIDFERFHPNHNLGMSFRKKLFIKNDTFIIGMVARYDQNKGIKFFLEVMRDVIDNYKNIKIILCGTGMEFNNKELLKNITEEGLINNVILLGEQKKMPDIFNSLDLLISTSITESFGLVVLEALACGTNAICSDLPALREFVSPNNLIKPNDRLGFASKIRNAIKYKTTLKNNNIILEKYDIKKTVANYYKIYQ